MRVNQFSCRTRRWLISLRTGEAMLDFSNQGTKEGNRGGNDAGVLFDLAPDEKVGSIHALLYPTRVPLDKDVETDG